MAVSSQPAAIITGAGSGIGRAIAARLAEAGWRVALVGRTESKLLETASIIRARQSRDSDTLVIVADVGDPAQPGRIIDHALRAFSRVDGLVNNAAVGPLKPLAETTESDLRLTFETDLFGPVRLVARLWRVFIEQGGGCVVNISSMATVSPFPGLSVYAMAKSGLESLTRSIHNEGHERGITAYSIAPGAVETPLLRSIFSESQIPRDRTLDPDAVASVAVECLLGRRPEDRGRVIILPSP